MTRAEALAGAVQMILDLMPAEMRDEIIYTPGMLEDVVKTVERLIEETSDGARLNNMTMDEFMRAYARGLLGGGEAGQA